MIEIPLRRIQSLFAQGDFVRDMFPQNIVNAHAMLQALVDAAIDEGYTIPGIIDNPELLAQWLEEGGKRGSEATQAYEKLREWVAGQFEGVTGQDIANVNHAMVEAMFPKG